LVALVEGRERRPTMAVTSNGDTGGNGVARAAVPILYGDPYSTESLIDPYPFHEELREAGPVAWLERYDVWATGRHEHVRSILTDWRTYMSGAGVGLIDLRVDAWRPPSLLLEADPPDHTVVRSIIERVLSPRAVRILRERFSARAETLVDRLVGKGNFDAMEELARVFPVEAFADEVGVVEEGRENLLPYGDMVFNGQGPRNEYFREAMQNAAEVQEWIMASCQRANLAPGGFGMQIYEAADAGEITEQQAGMLVRSFLSAGLDTTVSALGNAVHLFATEPEQWALLRADPSLARPAFEEALRFETPVQVFSRTATGDTEVGGTSIARDDRVMIFFGAANRDPRRWENPDRFEVTRRASGHMAFGLGIHGCVGKPVARIEGEAVLGALARRVGRIELTGEPQRHLNNTVRGLDSLPVTFHAP
jgi:4-methoxybenzoate monooxygenase (O-demethylating)